MEYKRLTKIGVLIQNCIFPFIAFFPFASGYLYSKGFKIGNFSFKLKQGSGIKNFVVALVWAFIIGALVYPVESFQLIFIFFFIKSFINTVIFDCRDVKGDLMVGLITIPVYLGEVNTRIILQILHSTFHIVTMSFAILNIIKFDLIILFYSWVGGIIYIFLYANSKKTMFRSLFVHGEWAHMLIFRSLAIRLF